MFIGHFAVGFAAKRAAPRTSLATLMVAAQLVDLVWPILLLLGIEAVRIDPGNTAFTPLDFEYYPWTHSLAMVVAWAVAFGVVYRLRTGYVRGALVVAALVLSHWVLDWISHRPDLPLAPGTLKVGLGLWNSRPATMFVEGLLFAAGLGVYLSTTRARGRIGSIGLWGFVAFVVLAYLGNLMGGAPPSPRAVAVVGVASWIFVPWLAWIDRNREVRAPPIEATSGSALSHPRRA
jgi:hypothetical protein